MSADEKWLVWMWQHYNLEVEVCDTRDEALTWAEDVQDAGNGSLMAVEGPSGLVSDEEYEAFMAIRRTKREAERAAERPYCFVVEIRSPAGEGKHGGKWASVDWCADQAEADASTEAWHGRVASDRVRVRQIGKGMA